MNVFKSAKVHPTVESLLPTEDSSGSEIDSCENGNNTSIVSMWNDLVEEFDSILEGQKGKKLELYMLDGEPLVKEMGTGTGLHFITEEVMKTYGLEFLNLVTDVITDATFTRGNSLKDILDQLNLLDYKKNEGRKLIVWIEDKDSYDSNESFGRLILTELLIRKIEPQMVIPCHDIDQEILFTLVTALNESFTRDSKFSDDASTTLAMKSVYHIGLSLALATTSCNLILIDSDKSFYETHKHHEFMEFAESLGHKVLYLRHNLKTFDKNEIVLETVKKVVQWNKTHSTIYDSLEETDEAVFETDEEFLKNSEILHKLTPGHFIHSQTEESEQVEQQTESEESATIE